MGDAQHRHDISDNAWCTSQQKLDTRTQKIGHESRVSKDAILDRTLKNDVVEAPTAKNSSAIVECLAVWRVALFKKFCKRDFCDEVRDFKIPEPEAVAS